MTTRAGVGPEDRTDRDGELNGAIPAARRHGPVAGTGACLCRWVGDRLAGAG